MSAAERNKSVETREILLAKRLEDQSRLLHKIYVGARCVIRQDENPDRLSLAACGFRELMDKFFQETQVEVSTPRESLKSKVNQLWGRWRDLRLDDISLAGGVEGSEFGRLIAFAKDAKEFFDWHRCHFPTFRKKIGDLLASTDGMKMRLPPSLHERSVNQWLDLFEFFNKTLHHNKPAELVEFLEQVECLEVALLNMLYPRTFADADEIDALLKESE